MKKTFIFLLIITLLGIAVYYGVTHYFSGKSSYQSIYLVPENAAFVIESDNVFDAWDKIVHSEAWKKIGRVPYFFELNKDIESLDSLLSKNKALLRAISNRKVLVSCHEFKAKKTAYLFILTVGKAASVRNPEKLFVSMLGDEFPITKRTYKDYTVYELLNKKSGEMYFFSLFADKAIVSTNYTLVEASIDEATKMNLGRNLDFIDVSKRISGKGLFNVYINYKYFAGYLENTLGKKTPSIGSLRKQLTFSAFSFDIRKDGALVLEGYTAVNDTVTSFFNSAVNSGESKFESVELIPDRIASLVKIGFNDATDYYLKSMENLNNYEAGNYQDNISKLEKKLKIDVEKHIFSWIDNEIVLLQTKPSNLGKNNEFALLIKGKNDTDPLENLNFFARQIEKNTPVKIKQVDYQGYQIRYISFPGLLKMLFGKMLSKIEKPYYTIIDNYVVFSNHPQTIKNIIDDYKQKKILGNNNSYNEFAGLFDKNNSAFAYIDIPVFFNNMKDFVSPATWGKINRQKPVITCFPQAGIEIGEHDNLLHLLMIAQYSEATSEFQTVNFDNDFLKLFASAQNISDTINTTKPWYEPEIIVDNLDSREMKISYDNGKLKFTVDLKSGMKHGSYKEYYENGKIHIKGKFKNDIINGEWKLYDETGSLIETRIFENGKEQTK